MTDLPEEVMDGNTTLCTVTASGGGYLAAYAGDAITISDINIFSRLHVGPLILDLDNKTVEIADDWTGTPKDAAKEILDAVRALAAEYGYALLLPAPETQE